MTDEEFQRLKETEKKHLRAKKRLQATLNQLKQQSGSGVQRVVQRMQQGAMRLLDETESLVDSLRRSTVEDQARFELALDEASVEDDDLRDADEALREERAEQLVRRMKAEEGDMLGTDPEGPSVDESSSGADEPHAEGPDKTIGRMGDLRADESS
ncbi:MAG: hypothetical protein V5A20_02530 [Salinibacter sp.]|jgi:hypothetical protein|uniref:hypothetical protein n=1 Tax=Salinibacter sp. TaxID=2065818 RepID=UPI002FC37239